MNRSALIDIVLYELHFEADTHTAVQDDTLRYFKTVVIVGRPFGRIRKCHFFGYCC